jgi:hypothetical protein
LNYCDSNYSCVIYLPNLTTIIICDLRLLRSYLVASSLSSITAISFSSSENCRAPTLFRTCCTVLAPGMGIAPAHQRHALLQPRLVCNIVTCTAVQVTAFLTFSHEVAQGYLRYSSAP